MEIANDLLQCGVKNSDLISCHRVDNKKGSVLMARFSVANIRDNKRKGKRIESNMLASLANSKKGAQILINEDLTINERQIFNMAYKFKKEKEYKYLWVKNGKIYLKKNDGDQALQIKNESSTRTAKNCWIFGDLNVDYLIESPQRLAIEQPAMGNSFQLLNTSTSTRVTSGCSTLIYCAFTNSGLNSQLAIFHGYVGDHRH
ncbi:hypothetical protein HHI36_006431 [Cryptolaemus montrouzieri]|uniref:FP protein C-terminal domain-containing protein n=1 Tax=Cryptolaemus montrouzieri TaxID=559131 RepID=A0ABD2NX53_9CUCU